MNLWISHPRSKKPDSMLTVGIIAFIACVFKFITNGVSVSLGDMTMNFGTVDAALIGALLTPTLGAYVIRKYKSSPDIKEESK